MLKPTESKLVKRIIKKDIKAFDILIQTYTKSVYCLAYQIMHINCTKEDIEECVSDVFVDVWRKIEDFDIRKGSFKTWVLILAKYKALQYKRNQKNINIVDIEEYQVISQFDIEQELIDKETQKEIINIINSWNDIDKKIFIRRYFFDDSISSLMDMFGLTRSAIDNRLLRCRKRLKEVMGNERQTDEKNAL